MEQDSINLLRDSLTQHYNLRNALDQKASFLSALSGIIFGLSIGHLEKPYFLILAISSFLTVFVSILAVFLPFRRIKGRFSLICWWGFLGQDFEQYKRGLNDVFVSRERTAEEYMREIWNLGNYSLKPKSKILKFASVILISGLLGAIIAFFI